MSFLKYLFALFSAAILFFGNPVIGLILVLFNGLLNALSYKGRSILSLCVNTCELTDLSTSDACKVRGGISCIYWIRCTELDLEQMAADYDDTVGCLTGYVKKAPAVWSKLSFDKKNAFYDFTYTEDDDVYVQLITIIFEGQSKELRNAFCHAVQCCDIILHIIDNNCLTRTVGLEWDGCNFTKQTKTLRIGRHLDSSGQLGDSKARNEIDFVGESICPPIYNTVAEADLNP